MMVPHNNYSKKNDTVFKKFSTQYASCINANFIGFKQQTRKACCTKVVRLRHFLHHCGVSDSCQDRFLLGGVLVYIGFVYGVFDELVGF
jgi:hypothetical protein